MILKKEKWNNKDYNQFINYLNELKDITYSEFNKKITKDNTIIGIKTPKLRYISKEIFSGNYKDFLKLVKFNFYEEKLIYGFIIGNINIFNNDVKEYLNTYLKYIDNWALCDLFCTNLKFIKNNKDLFLKYIIKLINENNLWIKRFCFVILLNYYIEKDNLKLIFNMCDTYNTNDYYVEMSVAWLISMCYIKYKDETKKYLFNNKLNDFTHDKTIQKIVESKQININEKEILKQMKRRKYENRNSK